MSGRGRRDVALDFRTAVLLGLITSTFSTVIATLGAARIGRDAAVDWMVVAAIPARDPVLLATPTWTVILLGIAFHQWADFSWEVTFFGPLGRWTSGLRPWALLLLGVPWAVLTSALEWLFLVPLLPFRQPIFTLEQPYWLGLAVHLFSSSLYPLFPWLRDRLARRAPSPHRRFALVWGGLAVAGTLALAAVAFLGSRDREPPYAGDGLTAAFDQAYMRRMAAHHEQGVEVAGIAAEKATDPHLRALARLMQAAQEGEIAIFGQWWRSWFGGPLPPATPEDHATMPGMLTPQQVASLRQASGPDFDPLFVRLMTFHHEGAVAMAQEAMDRGGDPRLVVMAQAIRHEQRGEIALMHGADGLDAVRDAVADLLTPAGAAPPEPARGAARTGGS